MRTRKAMRESSTGFIIDLYNKYAKNKDVVYTFKIHGQDYCIREVKKFEWGQPIFDRNIDDTFDDFRVYNTIEEAKIYINYLKRLEGSRF